MRHEGKARSLSFRHAAWVEHVDGQDVRSVCPYSILRETVSLLCFYLVMQEGSRIKRFLSALETEIAFYAAQIGRAGTRVSTVYVGGGTPTALSAVQLSQVLTKISVEFSLTQDCEVTVEATPESLTSEYLDQLLASGVTRLSMGIQTFEPEERTCLGLRVHWRRRHEEFD